MPGRPGGCSRSTAVSGGGTGDLAFLERVFHKLLLNFTWWVNRKDATRPQHFSGRLSRHWTTSASSTAAKPLPTGGYLNQADGTAGWRMYCLNLLRIALELALHNHVYEDIATKFFEHFLEIAEAMTQHGRRRQAGPVGRGGRVLLQRAEPARRPDRAAEGRVPWSGLIPLFAVETLEPELLEQLPDFSRRLKWFLNNSPDLAGLVSRWHEPGRGERRLLSLLRGHRMKQLLKRMLDETEFLSDYGVRALSREHRAQPYVFRLERPVFDRGLRAGRIGARASSAAIPTGAGRSGSRSTT